MSPEITVIVPAYNAEKYLTDCLESVIRQSFDSWELIIADDGSSDRTGVIADEYAAKDRRIKVLHLPNQGVSASRNACIDIATGKYVVFGDADDLMEPDFLKALYGKAEENKADITQCSFYFLNDNKKTENPGSVDALYQGQKEILEAFFRGAVGDVRISVWAKLFRREKFMDVRFDTGLRVYEDAFYVYECSLKAEKVYSFSLPLYIYRQHEGSTMHSRLAFIYPDYFRVFDKQREYLTGNKPVLKMLAQREIEYTLWLMRTVTTEGNYRDLWSLRKLALRRAGTIMASGAPVFLKMKILGLAIMPHLYFAMLKGRVAKENEKV